MNYPKRAVGALLAVVAILGFFHFTCSLYWVAVMMFGDPPIAGKLLIFALPYIGLWVVFFLGFGLAMRARLRWAATAVLLGIALSLLAFAYDVKHERYQILTGGVGPGYLIWWWYSAPYWEGYRPGPV